jgi:inner membrane protein
MTGRTHDLAAFTALTLSIASGTVTHMSLATALVSFSANMIGGLAPDIDQPTSALWNRIPAGSIIGRMITPVLGGHRLISHSVLGIVVFGVVLQFVLNLASSVVLVDMNIVWWSFMLGFLSHIFMDLFTKEGEPLLFPIPFHFGFPPLRVLRVSTGKLFEKSVIFPILIVFNGYLIYTHYSQFLNFVHSLFK